MTVQNPPVFIQAGTHPAEDVRRGFESIYKGYGVVPATITGAGASATSDLKVVQGTGMSVTVQCISVTTEVTSRCWLRQRTLLVPVLTLL